MNRKVITVIMALFFMLTFMSCDEDGSINFFTLDQDVEFGEEFHNQLISNPDEYPILSPSAYPEAYNHLETIRNELLKSDDLRYASEFSWDVYIIENDEVLNAFCVPGGKMYFYTGIIKFLDNESEFAGVMAHEMAHADRRHSTKTMTKQYGFSILLSALLGDDPSTLAQIAADLAQGLGSLAFSRDHEYEADEYAVRYTTDGTGDYNYYPKGISAFFEKMEGQPTPPEFLSTHPSPENRLESINEFWMSIGSPDGELYMARYLDFINSLPE
ncbi:MAG: M48 family metalloprotease [Bacteroidales bacterium]|jgi:predicted Zn-dependent protease|nr:M48 family metalloprotease [Bacteroidales bacterium]